MKQTYRAVLAGTGGIGDTHARAVRATQGRVELVGAMDVDAARAAAERFHQRAVRRVANHIPGNDTCFRRRAAATDIGDDQPAAVA